MRRLCFICEILSVSSLDILFLMLPESTQNLIFLLPDILFLFNELEKMGNSIILSFSILFLILTTQVQQTLPLWVTCCLFPELI